VPANLRRFHRPVIAAPVQPCFIDRYRDIAGFDIDIGPGSDACLAMA
jgi:hypothetical protein